MLNHKKENKGPLTWPLCKYWRITFSPNTFLSIFWLECAIQCTIVMNFFTFTQYVYIISNQLVDYVCRCMSSNWPEWDKSCSVVSGQGVGRSPAQDRSPSHTVGYCPRNIGGSSGNLMKTLIWKPEKLHLTLRLRVCILRTN